MPTLRIPVDTQRARAHSGPEPGRTGKITGVSSYTDFFLGSTTVAGALTGSLFVSLSVTSEQLTGSDASVELQSAAATLVLVFFGSAWHVPGNCSACGAAGCSTCWQSGAAGRRWPGTIMTRAPTGLNAVG